MIQKSLGIIEVANFNFYVLLQPRVLGKLAVQGLLAVVVLVFALVVQEPPPSVVWLFRMYVTVVPANVVVQVLVRPHPQPHWVLV